MFFGIRMTKLATEMFFLSGTDDTRRVGTVFSACSERVATQFAFDTRLFSIPVSIN
jgi:hypothetical protein